MAPYREVVGEGAPERLVEHVSGADFPVRMVRYWLAGRAIGAEAKRQGRALTVVDLGCERGWLKWFTPGEAVERWVGLDWNPRRKELVAAAYDEVIDANFDETLPVGTGSADVVVALHVFEHLPRPGFTMAEVSRVLRPGGICVAGAPTAPGWVARLREGYFRRRLSQGKITMGGHINCLSPGRWRRLAYETGLETEVLTGTHGVRLSGSRVESSRLWVRLNQLWGGLFPGLGSDCYLIARRSAPWAAAAEKLHRRAVHVRWVRLTLGGLGLAAAGAAVWALGLHFLVTPHEEAERMMDGWLSVEQDGNDHFYLHESWFGGALAERVDVTLVSSSDEIPSPELDGTDVYLVMSEETARAWGEKGGLGGFEVTSQLEVGGKEFALLEREGRLGDCVRG